MIFFDGFSAAELPLISMKSSVDMTDDERGYVALLQDINEQLRVGEAQMALDIAEKTAAHQLADAEVFFLRARAHRQLADYEAAMQDYRTALQRHAGYAVSE